MVVPSSASTLFHFYIVLLLSAVLVYRCSASFVGSADVSAGDVLQSVDGEAALGVIHSASGGESESGRVAALLSPRLAACVVKAQPGLARFIRSHAAFYPQLRVVHTGEVARLQVFTSKQHMRDNIVDSDEESDEQLIHRLQHPNSQPVFTHTPLQAALSDRHTLLPPLESSLAVFSCASVRALRRLRTSQATQHSPLNSSARSLRLTRPTRLTQHHHAQCTMHTTLARLSNRPASCCVVLFSVACVVCVSAPVAELELSDLSEGEIMRALAFYRIHRSSHSNTTQTQTQSRTSHKPFASPLTPTDTTLCLPLSPCTSDTASDDVLPSDSEEQ